MTNDVTHDADLERTCKVRADFLIIPNAAGWWLWLDGTPTGTAAFLHDPTGDGLQFDSGANSAETDLGAFVWGGRLSVEGAVEQARREEFSERELVRLRATGIPIEAALAEALENARRQPLAELPGGLADVSVEGGRFSPSDFDCVEYLNTTPTGACRRVTETSGGESLTFEDDRRLPSASEEGTSELAKLESLVRKMVDGNFGAGKFLIGGLEVYVADPRYTTAVSGGINVSTSQALRTGG